MIKCSCKGCEKRSMGCHSVCEDYKTYAQALSEKRHVEYKNRHDDIKIEMYIKKQKEKCAKLRGD